MVFVAALHYFKALQYSLCHCSWVLSIK